MKGFYASKCIQPIRTVKDTFGGAGSNLYMYQERSIHSLWQRTLMSWLMTLVCSTHPEKPSMPAFCIDVSM